MMRGLTLGDSSVWRNRDFVRLWVALTVSFLGDFFSIFALPLLVFGLTGSALQTGLSLAFSTVPYDVVSPFAGVLIDRADRRRVMVTTRVAEMVLIGSIPLASVFGWLTLGQIYAVGFLAGSAAVVFGAATLRREILGSGRLAVRIPYGIEGELHVRRAERLAVLVMPGCSVKV